MLGQGDADFVEPLIDLIGDQNVVGAALPDDPHPQLRDAIAAEKTPPLIGAFFDAGDVAQANRIASPLRAGRKQRQTREILRRSIGAIGPHREIDGS